MKPAGVAGVGSCRLRPRGPSRGDGMRGGTAVREETGGRNVGDFYLIAREKKRGDPDTEFPTPPPRRAATRPRDAPHASGAVSGLIAFVPHLPHRRLQRGRPVLRPTRERGLAAADPRSDSSRRRLSLLEAGAMGSSTEGALAAPDGRARRVSSGQRFAGPTTRAGSQRRVELSTLCGAPHSE